MPTLSPCASCGTHVRSGAGLCPHCGGRTTAALGATVTSTRAALLLGLALTGCGPIMGQSKYGIADTSFEDADADGYDVSVDCDDDDPSIHPDAEETADDGVDSNCDGEDNT